MKQAIILLIIAFSFSSCKNLIPYTDAIKNRNGWSDAKIKKIQFYVSHDVVLQREFKEGSTEIVNGKIRTVNGKKIEEVIIRRGTPGVLTQIPRENKMLVSFEIGDDHYLSFGINPKLGEKYMLLASEWQDGIGKIHYANKEYLSDPGSKYAYLMVDLRKIQKLELNQRVAKGRKVE